MNSASHLAAACAAGLAFIPVGAQALGFRITDIGAEGTARGGAFAATADNPSAIYHNPAGITQLEGMRSLLGVNVIAFESSVDLDAPGPRFDSDYSPQAVPHSFVTLMPKGSPIGVGLGVYSPFGLALEFDNNSPFRTLATKGYIQYITWNPVIAWKINDTLSVAGGATINYSRNMLARGVVTPGDEFQFKGAGIGYGFNVGLLWKPVPQHSFGVTWFSATDIEYSGHSRLRIPSFNVATPVGVFPTPRIEQEQDADATIKYPGTLTAGYSYRPTPDWNFEADIEWTDWDRLNTVTLHQGTGNVDLPFDYESSFLYEFGITRKLPRDFSVSVGYIYSENSVPNESFSPLVPDSNRHVLSAGIGQRINRYDWYLSYQYAYGPHRTIENNSPANGDYRFESHALSFSLGYSF